MESLRLKDHPVMPLPRRSPIWASLIGVAGTCVALGLRLWSNGDVSSSLASLTFLTAVVAAGALGGLKPGLITTFGMTGAALFFLHDRRNYFAWPHSREYLRFLAYVAAGLAISVLCEALWSAWKRAEERRRQLEQEIAERRKAELAVQQQAAQLRETDRRKDEFLAMLAHELRNPLAPLSNALQLWPIVENDAARMDELRAMMDRQVQQMIRLIDDLLDVSRISRGKIQLRREQVDLVSLLSSVVESLQSTLNESQHRLTVSLPTEPLFVDGDVARLCQIFGNILNNAVKYGGAAGVIWLSLVRHGQTARVSIRDNGPGIPKHMLSSIFDLFQQVDQTINRRHGGLGIGLTLVKRLVELHGGSVEAHSEGPGMGSEFIVQLPTLPQPSPVEAVHAPRHMLRQVTGLPRRRVLVVDDVVDSARTLAMILRSMGQEVSLAHDGRVALELIRSNRPDAVFLDIAMPGMNGYDVARAVRTDSMLDEICLIALTGYGQQEDRRLALDVGFNHHLTKPASIESLENLLRQPFLATANRAILAAPGTSS